MYPFTAPLPSQLKFHTSNKKYRLLVGGYGSGKSKAGCWDIFKIAMKYPGSVCIVCRNTYPELQDSTREVFFEILSEITEKITGKPGNKYDPTTCPLVLKFIGSKNNLLLWTGKGRDPSLIRFRSLDRPEKFKSGQITAFLLDEASDIPNTNAFLTLIGRLRLPNRDSYYAGILTTNPCTKAHWIYKYWVKNETGETELKHNDFAWWNAKTSENKYLPDGYEETLRQVYDKAWAKRYLDGEFGFIPLGKPVYMEFNEKTHVKRINPNYRFSFHRSWDFGLHNPACLVAQVEKGKVHIFFELSGKDELIENFARRVIRECKNVFGPNAKYFDYCDRSGSFRNDRSETTSISILTNLFDIAPIYSYVSIMDSIQLVRNLLHLKTTNPSVGLSISPECEVLVEAFKGGYHYPEKFDGQGDDPLPVKDGYYDHLPDAFRYLIANNPELKTWLFHKNTKEQGRGTVFYAYDSILHPEKYQGGLC